MNYNFPYTYKAVRTAAILTTSYVAGTVLGVEVASPQDDVISYNQLVLDVDFTIGSLTSAQIKVEFSDDNSTWFQEVVESISGGTLSTSLAVHELIATGKYHIPLTTAARYIKVSAKGTGTVTASEMSIKCILAIR